MDNAVSQESALQYQMIGLLPRLRRFARTLAKDPDKADDLVQAACERALNRLDHIREGTRLDSWLYRIVYTQWIDKLRRLKTRSAKLIVLSNENKSIDAGNGSEDHIETALDLQKALRALPEEHHAAIMLICVEGYSYAQAALILDVPAGTVASRVARGRAMLGRLLFNERPASLRLTPLDRMEEKNESAI